MNVIASTPSHSWFSLRNKRILMTKKWIISLYFFLYPTHRDLGSYYHYYYYYYRLRCSLNWCKDNEFFICIFFLHNHLFCNTPCYGILASLFYYFCYQNLRIYRFFFAHKLFQNRRDGNVVVCHRSSRNRDTQSVLNVYNKKQCLVNNSRVKWMEKEIE